MPQIHGTCIEISGIGILFKGVSGSGKSDLALRCLFAGAKLVADDIVIINKEGDELIASSPSKLKGLLEVRGVGIVTKPYVNITKLGLIVELEKDNKISRIPEEEVCNIDGVMLKHINLNPFEISAVEKLKTIINIILGEEAIYEGVLDGNNDY